MNRGQRRQHEPIFGRDTSPEARAILIRRMREMTMEEKAERVWELTKQTRELARAGLRARHPDASEEEIRWRFVALLHGRETARRMYGWDPDE